MANDVQQSRDRLDQAVRTHQANQKAHGQAKVSLEDSEAELKGYLAQTPTSPTSPN